MQTLIVGFSFAIFGCNKATKQIVHFMFFGRKYTSSKYRNSKQYSFFFVALVCFDTTDINKKCYEYSKIQSNLLSVVNRMQFTVF